jgi:hypothetical protein
MCKKQSPSDNIQASEDLVFDRRVCQTVRLKYGKRCEDLTHPPDVRIDN